MKFDNLNDLKKFVVSLNQRLEALFEKVFLFLSGFLLILFCLLAIIGEIATYHYHTIMNEVQFLSVLVLLVLMIIQTLEYYQYWYYLSKHYPRTLVWLKGGSLFEKGQFFGFNPGRSLDLHFLKTNKFIKQYEKSDFIEEYQSLIIKSRFIFRKRFLMVLFITIFTIISLIAINSTYRMLVQ